MTDRIKVTMDGAAYLAHERERLKRQDRFVRNALIWAAVAVGFVSVFIGVRVLLDAFVPAPHPDPVTIQDGFAFAMDTAREPWGVWLRFVLTLLLPFIAVGWVLHGVQVKLFA